ncbi:hypothetical protein GGI25_000439 [Coemansia spiralis]|uniref:Acid phosphatase n=2 Tax=Coemansia TaxID=4863 RepID=A0A9W8L152_9FUNG|nr:histidine phosphatase superfamily [Coemansia spiralis]KAJ1996375.1 hypothetical protein EDC05_000266 [Coemansia umbellata]KAJ2624161.1 hypothetical protein GGI26_001736 [Coemansia sp. RSA 1358]KAJ2680803.1 hypothetical protein GGI25_000439 [Coemansia spiralis]
MAITGPTPSNSEHTTPNPAQARLPKLTQEFINKNYPHELSLVHVDVLTRHGERTPVLNVFAKISPKYWNFCKTGNQLHADFKKIAGIYSDASTADNNAGPPDSTKQWADRMFRHEESRVKTVFGIDDKEAQQHTNDKSQLSSATCGFGQLTDVGRESMTALGQHLRKLYVETLGLVQPTPQPGIHGPTDEVYLRSTSFSRAFESLQHTLGGLYSSATEQLPLFQVNVRPTSRDNLIVNFDCKNMVRLFTKFNLKVKELAAVEYDALYSDLLKVDGLREYYESHPKSIKGPTAIYAWDTVASMRAHGIPLPKVVDDTLIARISQMSAVEYAHSLWKSTALTRMQSGPLIHELVGNMVGAVEADRAGSFNNNGLAKMGIYSGHDTTIGPLLAAFGKRLDDYKQQNEDINSIGWVPYASSLRIELLKDNKTPYPSIRPAWEDDQAYHSEDLSMVPFSKRVRPINVPDSLYRWSPNKPRSGSKASFNPRATRDYYVRVWYNDHTLQLPACADPGAHHPKLGTTMCTLDGFFKQVARFVPNEEETLRECLMPAENASILD